MRTFFLICVLTLCGLFGSAFGAFSIEPALVSIQVDKKENSAWLDVVHTGGGPLAVELTIFERTLDLEGEATTSVSSMKKSGDFVLYPAQIILYPNEKARAQVVYKGGAVTADKTYFLFSKEVPLKIDDGESGGVKIGINTLTNYFTVISLSTGKPGKLTFVSSKDIGDGMIEVIVENKSGGRVQADRLAITVGGTKITEFTGKKNSIMPGQTRRFTFKHPKPVTAKEISFEGS